MVAPVITHNFVSPHNQGPDPTLVYGPQWNAGHTVTGLDGVPANVLNNVAANYTIQASDTGKTIQAGTGATGFFSITLPPVAGFATNAVVTIVNGDTTRGKALVNFPTGVSPILWPLQSISVGIVNGAWATLTRPGRWKPANSATINFYSDFANGSDAFGATDGLAPGAAAFKSAERCFLNAADQIDFNAASQTQVICNMAAATVDTQGMHSPVHAMVGAQGGAAFQVVGASLAISNVVSNGGLCKITVPSTASYSANQVVSVYGVNGATGCNGTWKVTVTSATELTLQGTTFGGAYTNGGTVTNGSSFNVTGNAVDTYFGTVCQFSNVTFNATQNCLGVNWGSKVYLQPGNIFASCGGSHLYINSQGQIRVEGSIGIAAGASNAFLQTQSQGLFLSDLSASIDFLPGVNPSFNGLSFLYVEGQGQANFANLTINLNGNTVTGTRFKVLHGGCIGTGLGSGDLNYFPGNVAGSQATGGVYDNVTGAALQGPTVTSTTTGTASVTSAGGFAALDVSSNANALRMSTGMAIGANSNGIACPPSTAGLIMVSDVSVSGVGALFFIASTGSIQKLTTGGLWTNTTTPAASNFGFAWDGTNFRIYNGFGSIVNFRALSISTS